MGCLPKMVFSSFDNAKFLESTVQQYGIKG